MAAPSVLTSFPTTVTVDAIDLHLYGMVVNKIVNPVPKSRSNVLSIYGKDGDYDFTKNYSPRTMTISGFIIGTTNSDLQSRIDSLKNIFRLRVNGDSFQVIFQNQTDRYWTCKYSGLFKVTPLSTWYAGTKAKFSLVLKCVKPYAEAVTISTINKQMTVYDLETISNTGNVPTPLNVTLTPKGNDNLLDKSLGYITSEVTTGWFQGGGSGPSISAVTTQALFGTNEIKGAWTGDAGDDRYLLQGDMSSEIDALKYYVMVAYARVNTGVNLLNLKLLTDGAGGNKTQGFDTATGRHTEYHMAFIKVQPSDLTGLSYLRMELRTTVTTPALEIHFDGTGVYEITSAQYADSSYTPPPYSNYLAPTNINLGLYNPGMEVVKVANLFNYKYNSNRGFDSTDGRAEIASDPLTGETCTSVSDTTNSELMPVIGGTEYKIQFDYFVTAIGSSPSDMDIFLDEYIGSVLVHSTLSKALTQSSSAWATQQSTITVPLAIDGLKIRVEKDSVDVNVLLKNFLVDSSGSFASVKPKFDSDKLAFTVQLDKNDSLSFDSERITATLTDLSAVTVVNGMSVLTSGKSLVLNPGTNTFRISDTRSSQLTSGVSQVFASYRKRYL